MPAADSPSAADPAADSAGQPWAGRTFEPNHAADDDGSAPPHLLAALTAFRAGEGSETAVVDAVRTARLLIPLVAHLGEAGENEHGHTVDKTQELAIVTVVGPDGRTVLPAFSSVAAMTAWNPAARPVPAEGVRVAVAAASEGTDLVVLDPRSATEFAIRRPAVLAIAGGEPWTPSFRDEAVLDAIAGVASLESAVRSVGLAPGDPEARLAGPELVVHLAIEAGLDERQLAALLERLQEGWAESELIAARVDSMRVQVRPSA